jgi:hypothetical protein
MAATVKCLLRVVGRRTYLVFLLHGFGLTSDIIVRFRRKCWKSAPYLLIRSGSADIAGDILDKQSPRPKRRILSISHIFGQHDVESHGRNTEFVLLEQFDEGEPCIKVR